MKNPDHPLIPLLAELVEKKPRYLEGADGQHWQLAIEPELPKWLVDRVPPGSLVFADNGVGDVLFLSDEQTGVQVFWHEGALVEIYAPSVAELEPSFARPPSDHPPIRYRALDQIVQVGDRVMVRYWLLFKDPGTVRYVPGVSAKKPSMERDGLAWVGIALDAGKGRVDTIVMPDGALKKGVSPLTGGAESSVADISAGKKGR